MKAKKIISMMLAGVMVMGLLAGCSSNAGGSGRDTEETVQSETETEAQETETQEAAESAEEETVQSDTQEETEAQSQLQSAAGDTEAAADTASDTANVLVVYYSATGNTEAVANTIAEATGGDLFELEPADPYTDEDLDWTNDDSRVSTEYANEDQRDVELVAATVDNWDSYDTVFIGYPIWWGIAAWPVDTFVEANDFTGKTVIPFCTSSTSDIGESGQLLADLAGTGDWQAGMRFRSGVDAVDVQAWVEELGL